MASNWSGFGADDPAGQMIKSESAARFSASEADVLLDFDTNLFFQKSFGAPFEAAFKPDDDPSRQDDLRKTHHINNNNGSFRAEFHPEEKGVARPRPSLDTSLSSFLFGHNDILTNLEAEHILQQCSSSLTDTDSVLHQNGAAFSTGYSMEPNSQAATPPWGISHHSSQTPETRMPSVSRHQFNVELRPIPENGDANLSFPATNRLATQPRPVQFKPSSPSYNISFPGRPNRKDGAASSYESGSDRQPRNSPGYPLYRSNSSYTYSSNSSPGSSLQSPFHEALRTAAFDIMEFQPLNVIRSDDQQISESFANLSSNATTAKKASKRSRESDLCATRESDVTLRGGHEKDKDEGSSRQKRRSAQGDSSKKNEPIKDGIEELQKMLPHLKMSENQKISQATVLVEAAKYIKTLRSDQELMSNRIAKINDDIDELNNRIELFQSHLPEDGASLLPPRALLSRSLPELFHDHVVEQTHENWRYWVFTAIFGHLVHSFAQDVSASSISELETSSLAWIFNSMSLQQLRKDAIRKLAKVCVKTSVVESPSKLPQEAMRYVTHRGKGSKLPAWCTDSPFP